MITAIIVLLLIRVATPIEVCKMAKQLEPTQQNIAGLQESMYIICYKIVVGHSVKTNYTAQMGVDAQDAKAKAMERLRSNDNTGTLSFVKIEPYKIKD